LESERGRRKVFHLQEGSGGLAKSRGVRRNKRKTKLNADAERCTLKRGGGRGKKEKREEKKVVGRHKEGERRGSLRSNRDG